MMEDLHGILARYRKVLIQIATPYSTGTGFYLAAHNLVVTNEHLVRGNRTVVIKNECFEKQVVHVVFVDAALDIAFLQGPEADLDLIELQPEEASVGDLVLAIGHPFGLTLSNAEGQITGTVQNLNDVVHLHHNAILGPGYSGGPLVNESAEVIGMNTFVVRDGNPFAFALPAKYLIEALEIFHQGGSEISARCNTCFNLVKASDVVDKYCPHCGSKLVLPSQLEDYEAEGICKTIEEILMQLGHDVQLARVGPNLWQIIEGSAKVYLTYHEESGLIIGDSYLAQLPQQDIGGIYEFLLHENHRQENLSFSVKGNDIILSLIIYDRYLNVETGALLMKRLFKMSDHYDDILVEKYGARWRENLNE